MVSCFNAVSKAAKHLHSQHGEVSALKLVASELRKARRARSRKRFIFLGVGRGATCRIELDDPIRPTRKSHRSACGQTSLVLGRHRVRLEEFPCHSFVIALGLGEQQSPNWKDF
jgi:hypothetical protein